MAVKSITIFSVAYVHKSKKVRDWTDIETIFTHREQEAGDLANLFANSEEFELIAVGEADDVNRDLPTLVEEFINR